MDLNLLLSVPYATPFHHVCIHYADFTHKKLHISQQIQFTPYYHPNHCWQNMLMISDGSNRGQNEQICFLYFNISQLYRTEGPPAVGVCLSCTFSLAEGRLIHGCLSLFFLKFSNCLDANSGSLCKWSCCQFLQFYFSILHLSIFCSYWVIQR